MEVIARGMRGRARAAVPAMVAAVLALPTLVPSRVQGQAQAQAQQALFSRAAFAPRPQVVDYTRGYTTVEDCLAAVTRVRDSTHRGTVQADFDPTRWEEVLPVSDPRRPEPPAVIETARRCGARFAVPTAAEADLPLLWDLWLVAAEDSLAEAVVRRQLALIPPAAPPARRGEVLARTIGDLVRRARPARLAWAERLLGDLSGLGLDAQLGGYGHLFWYAKAVYDTLRADHYLGAAVALADSFPVTSAAQTSYLTSVRRLLHVGALNFQRLRTLARGQGVEPHAVFLARARSVLNGQTMVPTAVAVAESTTMVPLKGNFWFRRADSTVPRPTRGKPGLVVFLDLADGCAQAGRNWGDCFGVAVLRELHQRFGDALEITLMTHTHGYVGNYPPPAPAEEAELLRRYYSDYLQLPGALAVETTPFTHLPPPDGRRVDQPPVYVTTYRDPVNPSGLPHPNDFGLKSDHREWMTGFLVDREGRVLLEIEDLGNPDLRLLIREAIGGYVARSKVASVRSPATGE